MTLRNKILLTIGTLITVTALTIIYIASKAISYSDTSHAYSLLSINNNNLSTDTKNKVSRLKNYAVTIVYNYINSLNLPAESLNPKIISNVTIKNYKGKKLINYPENTTNACRTIRKYYHLKNILFSKTRRKKNSLCIYIPVTLSEKKHLAVFNVSLNFFDKRNTPLPTLIIAPNKFELNLTNYTLLDFRSARFKNLVNPNIIRGKTSFLITDKHFVLFQKVPNTNLRILSYSKLATAKTSHQVFLYSSIGLMLLILAISIVIFFFLVNSFLRPIKELCSASRYFANGKYDKEIESSKFAELNELISSFNAMINKIREREWELKRLNKNLEKEVEKKTSELIHSAKMASLGTLAGGMAHEFNNILGAVVGHVSLALEKKNRKEMISALEIALMATERACDIISRLQDFTKKKEFTPKLFDINDAINNVIKLIEKDFINFKINIKTNLARKVPINGDQSQIEQIILNLFINSRHAMPDGGIIFVNTKAEKDKIRLRISDTGTGIDKEIRDRIFEPFFTTKGVVGTGKSFGSQDTEGTGLGLTVTLGIIEHHGGDIKLVSTSDKGTTFEITLPIAND